MRNYFTSSKSYSTSSVTPNSKEYNGVNNNIKYIINTAAASLLYEVARARLDNGKRTYVAYVDFSKAFDTIRRDILFVKMQTLGFPIELCTLLDHIYRNLTFVIRSGKFLTEKFVSKPFYSRPPKLFSTHWYFLSRFLHNLHNVCRRSMYYCRFCGRASRSNRLIATILAILNLSNSRQLQQVKLV